MGEAVRFKSGVHCGCLNGVLPVVVCLSFGRGSVADGFQQSVVVKPGHPLHSGKFQLLLCFPGRTAVNHLRPVQTVDRLSQGIVITVALAAHLRFDARFGQPLAVANGHVLRAAI